MRFSVGTDNSVCAEINITSRHSGCVWNINKLMRLLTLKIGTVKIIIVTVFILNVECLVNKIPNKTAAHIVVLFKIVNIFLEISEGIFHTVCIFTKNNGLTFIHFSLNRLTVCCELIGNIIIKRDSYRLFITEFFHNILSRIHT